MFDDEGWASYLVPGGAGGQQLWVPVGPDSGDRRQPSPLPVNLHQEQVSMGGPRLHAGPAETIGQLFTDLPAGAGDDVGTPGDLPDLEVVLMTGQYQPDIRAVE